MIAQKYKKKDNLYRLSFFFVIVCKYIAAMSPLTSLVHHELHAVVLGTLVETQDVGT